MDVISQIVQKTQEAEELYRQSDLMEAYSTITASMGASEQLIAFINHDGKLSEELGGVALESMTTLDQHDLIMASLNPDALDQVAMENLTDAIHSFSGWLKGAGAVVAVGGIGTAAFTGGQKSLKVGLIGVAALLAGNIIDGINLAVGGVPPLREFKLWQDVFQHAMAEDTIAARLLPHTFTLEDWTKYDKELSDPEGEYSLAANKVFAAVFEYHYHKGAKVAPGSSGWNERTFLSAVEWLDASLKKMDAQQKSYGKQLDAIVKWVEENGTSKDKETKKIARMINRAIGKEAKLFRSSRDIVDAAHGVLNKVSRMFKFKTTEEDGKKKD